MFLLCVCKNAVKKLTRVIFMKTLFLLSIAWDTIRKHAQVHGLSHRRGLWVRAGGAGPLPLRKGIGYPSLAVFRFMFYIEMGRKGQIRVTKTFRLDMTRHSGHRFSAIALPVLSPLENY